MDKNKILLYILGILFIIVAFLTYEKLKVNIIININNPQVNELLNLNIEVKRFNKYVDAQEIEVEIFNKYKKDEAISSEITPYEIGKYQFFYLPQYSGNYIINVKINLNDKTYVKSKEIEI